MYENVSVADLRTFFQDSIILHKGRPKKVLTISDGKSFRILDLLSQKTIIDNNALDFIAPPLLRLGMVNHDGSACFMMRLPMRVMHIGLNRRNTTFSALEGGVFTYPYGWGRIHEALSDFDCVGIAETMLGHYPSFKDALKQVREFGGSCAFDRQFAVNVVGEIFYKTRRVGRIKDTHSTIAKISFDNGWESLRELIGGYNEDFVKNP